MFSVPDQLATSFGFEKVSVEINLGFRSFYVYGSELGSVEVLSIVVEV